MSEQDFDATPASAGPSPHTGVARVDAVLETLDRLEELPLAEHVGVFESAHTELRRALDPDEEAHGAMARVAAASGGAHPADQPAAQPDDQP